MMVWNIEFTKEAQKDIRKLREPSKSHVNEAINKVVNSPETAKKIADSGAELITGTPEDIAEAVRWLAQDARYVTGQTLRRYAHPARFEVA